MASLTARLTRTLLRALVQPTFTPEFGLKRQRQRLNALQQLMPMPFGVRKQITPCGGVPAWRLTPATVHDAGSAQNTGASVMLYLHGGGYVVGSPTSHGEMVARIAASAVLIPGLLITALLLNIQHQPPLRTHSVLTVPSVLRGR